jgi:microcystin-dependent protein
MATLTPVDEFSDVYSLATSDPVKGGAVSGPVDSPTDGQANAQAQSLANRTLYLFNRLIPAGIIVPYGGTSAPDGWLPCNGQTHSRTTRAALFAAIGTAYGAPSGTEFKVPDLRGRFLRGTNTFGGGSSGLDPDAASRTAMNPGGNTGDNVGSVQDDEFEAHTHDIESSGGSLSVNPVLAVSLYSSTPTTFTSESTGGNENRPKNAYVNFIISTGE